MQKTINEQEAKLEEQKSLIEQLESRIERHKNELRAIKVELDHVRNPPGFAAFINKLSQFRDYADEIEQSNIEKWQGL